MTLTEKIMFGAIVVVVAIIGTLGLLKLFSPTQHPVAGSLGGLLIENYDPYVQSNGGIKSALPITTTGAFTGGSLTTSGALAVSGASAFVGATFTGVVVHNNTLSTSTIASAETLNATDVSSYSSIVLTPNINAVTATFPASSTLSAFLPTAGEWTQECWFNATSTAAKTITFAAGTGETLQSASSTYIIYPGLSRCFTIMRNGGSGSESDDFSINLN